VRHRFATCGKLCHSPTGVVTLSLNTHSTLAFSQPICFLVLVTCQIRHDTHHVFKHDICSTIARAAELVSILSARNTTSQQSLQVSEPTRMLTQQRNSLFTITDAEDALECPRHGDDVEMELVRKMQEWLGFITGRLEVACDHRADALKKLQGHTETVSADHYSSSYSTVRKVDWGTMAPQSMNQPPRYRRPSSPP
jgi:hypothetical protein